jgi:hypothetical protein
MRIARGYNECTAQGTAACGNQARPWGLKSNIRYGGVVMNRSVLLLAALGTLALPFEALHAQDPEGAAEEVDVETEQGTETRLPADSEEAPEGEAELEESAILPNAEDHEESEAATMDLECDEDADNCLDPLTGPAVGPERSSPDEVETPEVEADESGEIVAEPEG